jgi:hypothetical protein
MHARSMSDLDTDPRAAGDLRSAVVGSDSNVKNYPPGSPRLSGTGRRDDYRRRRRLRLFTKVGAFIRMRRLCHRERARLLQMRMPWGGYRLRARTTEGQLAPLT